MTIISQVKINGKWVNQNELPEAVAQRMVQSALYRAMEEIRFFPGKKEKEKTA